MLIEAVRAMLILMILMAAQISTTAAQEKFDLVIPSATVPKAIKSLSFQTGHSVLFQTDDVEAIRTNAISGRYTVRDALNALLEGTSLSGGLTESGVVTISLVNDQSEGREGNMANNNRRKSLLMSVTALVFGTGGAVAQENSDGDGGAYSAVDTDQIVVTARKREEKLIDVPDAVTAFTAQRIEQAGLANIRDFSNLTPNITITPGAGRFAPVIMIRGLAQASGGEAPIAVTIDGVQVAHPSFINQNFGDIQQVEVLRGPQGSLYGRNAIGGAIVINTKTPTNEFSGQAKLQYGDANTFLARANVSGPIVSDKILFAVGAQYDRTDGRLRNVVSGREVDYGHTEFYYGRLIFNIADGLILDLRGNYGKDRVGQPSSELVSRADFDDFDPGFIMADTDPPLDDRRNIYSTSAKLDYENEHFSISSITAYMNTTNELTGDGDFSPAPILQQFTDFRAKAFSEELRIASSGEGRFRWLLGGFYQNRDTDNLLRLQPDDGTGQAVPGVFLLQSLDMQNSKSYAGFGSLSYDIVPDKLELTFGARYDIDKRESIDLAVPGSEVTETFESFSPKVQLAYKPNNNLTVYALYSEGFGSGGFNAYFSGPTNRVYKSQTAENYELGLKTSDPNGVFSVGANIFRVYYDDQQFFFYIAFPPSQNITNIDRTRVDGLEMEFALRPFENLDITGGLGLTDAKIRKFDLDPSVIGNRSPQNTGYTANLGAQYTQRLNDQLNLRGYAQYRRQGKEYWDAANTLVTEAKDFVNLRLFLEWERLSFGGFVENLTNSQYPVNVGVDAVGPDISLRIPSTRRSYGMELNYRF